MTEQEFSDFVAERYERFFRFICGRLGNDADAADVLQGALLRLFQARDNIVLATANAYFMRAFQNAIADFCRRPRREQPLPPEIDVVAPEYEPEPRPNLDAIERDYLDRLHLLRERLNEQQRQVLSVWAAARGVRATALTLIDPLLSGSYDRLLCRSRKLYREVMGSQLDEFECTLGLLRIWELLATVFDDCPDAPKEATP